MSTSEICKDKDGASKTEHCGKEGSDSDMNICNKCKLVKYCNASCKKKHRSKHKKQCDRRLAELHDEKLFKNLPSQYGDCPICFIRIPTLSTGRRYKSCCGKIICSGCMYAPVYDNQGNEVDNTKCPFCRTPATTHEEAIEREKKRMESDDAEAIYNTGCHYLEGFNGYPIDYTKALELWHRAADLEFAEAYNNIGALYNNGYGVEVNEKKAVHYYELAAMMGNEVARNNLGNMEKKAGNYKRALRHFMIAVSSGNTESLNMIKEMYSNGFATKEDYTKALQSYQAYLLEIKCAQRDEAAAFSDNFKYY